MYNYWMIVLFNVQFLKNVTPIFSILFIKIVNTQCYYNDEGITLNPVTL